MMDETDKIIGFNLKTKDKVPSKATALTEFGIDQVLTDDERYDVAEFTELYKKKNNLKKIKGVVIAKNVYEGEKK